MLYPRWNFLPAVLLITANIIVGCGGGGGGGTTMPATPTFTSTPVMGAEEGVMYSYQVTATSPDMSAITYELSSGPAGATLSGNTVSWTPTHLESRVGNAFTVKATTAAGGSATQTWNVTPNGTVNLIAVFSYWGPAGEKDVVRKWPILGNAPQVLIPQQDGSLILLAGGVNPDGSYSFPNVPAGYYWLEITPSSLYWTSTSDFDAGDNLIGYPASAGNLQQTTTFDYTLTGLTPPPTGGFIDVRTDLVDLEQLPPALIPALNSTTINQSVSLATLLDWSQVDTLYIQQSLLSAQGNFQGFVLGPTAIETGVSFVDGGTNSITATLQPSPSTAIALSIKGSEWAAAMQGIGPGTATPYYSDYVVAAQPYLGKGFVPNGVDIPKLGSFAMLQPASESAGIASTLPCTTLQYPPLPIGVTAGLSPIVSDVDYGTLNYGDPFPATWQRLLQYCQASQVSVPLPNSASANTFTVVNRQIVPLPTGPIAPLVTPVQNPTLNGSSFFSGANLTSTNVTLSWAAPTNGQPFGYRVQVYKLITLNGNSQYEPIMGLGTAKTSMQVPLLTGGNTYVFTISAEVDANANMETSPFRTKAPAAESTIISGAVVIPSQ